MLIGMVAGFSRAADALIMRLVMDGMMAIPGILLAVALMALMRASIETVVIAITVPEIPRVVRLVRLAGAGDPRAALRAGGRGHRHAAALDPAAPRAAQCSDAADRAGHFICASAVLFEAYLSFLGAGTPPRSRAGAT